MPSVAHSADNGARSVRERAMAPATAQSSWLHRHRGGCHLDHNGYTGFVQRISGDRAAVLLKAQLAGDPAEGPQPA